MPDLIAHFTKPRHQSGVDLDIKGGRHYTASQLLAGGFDLRNTAARLGHSGGGATSRCGIYGRIRSPRWTGEPPPTSRS